MNVQTAGNPDKENMGPAGPAGSRTTRMSCMAMKLDGVSGLSAR